MFKQKYLTTVCLTIILGLIVGAFSPVVANDPAGASNQRSVGAVSQSLEAALTEAKRADRFKRLVEVMEQESFGSGKDSSAEEKQKIGNLVDQVLTFLKERKKAKAGHPREFDDASRSSIGCLALCARYYATTDDPKKAIACYRDAISDSLALYAFSYEQPTLFVRSCQIGLALADLRVNDRAEAEALYKKILWPNANLKGEERKKRFKPGPNPLSARTGEAMVAAKLGQAYEADKLYDRAVEKYTDLLYFEARALDEGVHDPYSSVTIISKSSGSRDRYQSPLTGFDPLRGTYEIQRVDFDSLVGTYPPTEELVAPYLEFARKHPERVPADELANVQDQIQKVVTIRKARTTENQTFDNKMKEVMLVGHLRDDPDRASSILKEDIETRKKQNPTDPALASSMNLIGYQMMVVGLYKDAEALLKQAISIRGGQGRIGRPGLGQSQSSLGTLYLEEGKYSLAQPLIEKALELRKDDLDDPFAYAKTQIFFGRMLAAAGRPHDAERELKAAVEKLKNFDPHTDKLPRPLVTEPSRLAFEAAYSQHNLRHQTNVTAGRFYALALIELANFYIQNHRYDEARNAIALAKPQITPDQDLALDARAAEKLGRIDIATGKLEQAEKELSAAQKAITEKRACGMTAVDILSAMGDLKSKQGNDKEARDFYRTAADRLEKMLDANDPRVIQLRRLAS